MIAFRDALMAAQAKNNSCLCVGFDPEPSKFPGFLEGDPARIYDFCASVLDATKDLVCCYKPQIAYFAANRAEDQLERLIARIHEMAPGIPVILDAKRGDIGETAKQYAREAFERYRADALTLSPYMGFDSIEPYLSWDGKGLFLLDRTSNPGGAETQQCVMTTSQEFYAEIMRGRPADEEPSFLMSAQIPYYQYLAHLATNGRKWNASGRIGLVVGATHPEELRQVRRIAPHAPLLIPGVGAQGATERDAMSAWSPHAPVAVNSSRAVLYPKLLPGEEYMTAVRRAALATRDGLNTARSLSS